MRRFEPYFPAYFCSKCSLKQPHLRQPQKCEEFYSLQFIDFDAYKDSLKINPTPPSCDLLFFDDLKVIFIEHKAKDAFYLDNKSIDKIANNLEIKIKWSLQALFNKIPYCINSKKTYCILFSKKGINSINEPDNAFIERMILNNILSKFSDYQEGAFLFSKHKVSLIVGECSKINEIMI
ncbi:MAG: hypothetical protein LBT79_06890 [Elusimicrobiota bacterium]|jgi:hypothetical protein|nr:hypothetical protein [Elusimicrobiota bacterium]